MDSKDRWYELKFLGEGGQGKVYQVLDREKINFPDTIAAFLGYGRNYFHTPSLPKQEKESIAEWFQEFFKTLILSNDIRDSLGALKILHEPREARDPERAEERMQKEIHAMSKFTHSNIVRLINHDPSYKWFVSRFLTGGGLDKNLHVFKGKPFEALQALRPVIEAVAEIHSKGYVHRDIKPANIFLDDSGSLILGDLGIIFFSDESKTRISDTLENVGTRDWMPLWAQGCKIDDLNGAFDVFALGKVLWAMVSGRSFLRAWYWNKKEFNLVDQFPNQPEMKIINEVLAQAVLEDKEDTLQDAAALLEIVDESIQNLKLVPELIDPAAKRKCRVCGRGTYKGESSFTRTVDVRNFGFQTVGMRGFQIYSCNYCGHVQMFTAQDYENLPTAWRKK
jgi:serine/threonine protein kinase